MRYQEHGARTHDSYLPWSPPALLPTVPRHMYGAEEGWHQVFHPSHDRDRKHADDIHRRIPKISMMLSMLVFRPWCSKYYYPLPICSWEVARHSSKLYLPSVCGVWSRQWLALHPTWSQKVITCGVGGGGLLYITYMCRSRQCRLTVDEYDTALPPTTPMRVYDMTGIADVCAHFESA